MILTSARSEKYVALLNEYRVVLGLWSETRALYAPENWAVVEAEVYLADLEGDIRWLYGNSALPLTEQSVHALESNYDVVFTNQ